MKKYNTYYRQFQPPVDFLHRLRHISRRMTQHEWYEATETGERRYFRATHQGSRWRFETTLAKEELWHDVDPPDREYLEGLQKVLFNKYQRRRVPHKILAEINTMLEDLIEAEELAATTDNPTTGES